MDEYKIDERTEWYTWVKLNSDGGWEELKDEQGDKQTFYTKEEALDTDNVQFVRELAWGQGITEDIVLFKETREVIDRYEPLED